MIWEAWTFSLLDTGFFRDGQPFHAGEGGYSRVQSVFPPSAATLQGAIRTALAQAEGWRPEAPETWPEWLGGPDDLGVLRLRGPYLLKNGELYFAAPLHLWLGEGGVVGRLVPGEPVPCDLGPAVRLPRPAGEGRAGGGFPEGRFLTGEGLAAVLAGGVPAPDQLLPAGRFWVEEPRVGLERSRSTRTAQEGRLYQAVHVRPCRGVAVRVYVGGLPAKRIQLPKWVRLGGEGRAAAVTVEAVSEEAVVATLPPCPGLEADSDGTVRFTVTLLTPGCYADPAAVIRQGPPEIPGRCVSACIGKLRQIGGWSLEWGRPRALEPYLPAGSTWFFEAPAHEIGRIAALHGRCLGDRTNHGYGQIAVGRWEGGAKDK
ncbi:MAG: type III-B CRISPR module-associated Cmr3 family protein [Moorellales bacterium]